MKQAAALTLAAVLAAALTGCSAAPAAAGMSPEELTALYTEAITQHGGEMVEYNPVVSDFSQENAILLESMGLKEEDVEALGVSTSMMNVKAYAIAAVKPAQGKEEAVKQALQGFVDQKRTEFETYLPDQYEVAQEARLETLTDGTLLLVMCEGGEEIYNNIAAAIREG